MTDCFMLVRPLIHFSFEEVITRTNNVFVFEVLAQPEKKGRLEGFKLTSYDEVGGFFKYVDVENGYNTKENYLGQL